MRFTKRLVMSLALAIGCATAQDRATDDRLLYDKGIGLLTEGKTENGLRTLQTMVNFYPNSGLAQSATQELEAFGLYANAQQKLAAGNVQAATLALQTLRNRYPETTFAASAKTLLDRTAR